MSLVHKESDMGMAMYLFLAYLAFFFIDPIMNHYGPRGWFFTILAVAIFLVCYFCVYVLKGVGAKIAVAVIIALGAVYLPYNGGSVVFWIYGAGFLAYIWHNPYTATKLLCVHLTLLAAECWYLHLPTPAWITGIGFSALTGAINLSFAGRNRQNAKLRLAHEEIENLAKIAERERIARDMHDVLGHTLSVIILKSELAARLIERDPARAKSEMQDVETTSRKALAEVRHAILGYRANGLAEEFDKARGTLETAGLAVECEAAKVGLTAAQESVLSLIVREAVTNVVRHAHAQHCFLRLRLVGEQCELQIEDDGRGSSQAEGNGIRGMRERVEALGGVLIRETTKGTRLSIRLPLTLQMESKAS